MARAAATHAAGILTRAATRHGRARVIIATGNSQLAFVNSLRQHPVVPWGKIDVFHLDEYVGIGDGHQASFRRWLREHIVEVFNPRRMHYIVGDSSDLHQECRRYEKLLRAQPIDLVCIGIGENGHIAFNDPPVADFDDPLWVKVVKLEEKCRLQQVGEGHFPNLAAVPTHAITLSVPALLAPRHIQVVVPEKRKAAAIAATRRSPIGPACPSTILRAQEHARLFLDRSSASKIKRV